MHFSDSRGARRPGYAKAKDESETSSDVKDQLVKISISALDIMKIII